MNYIYCYTNLTNNKKYVGQTNNLDRRIREHKSNAFNPNSVNYNNVIHKALRKYGYDNFSLEVLETIVDPKEDEVNQREIFWIKELQTLVSQHGYNILEGGKNKFWSSVFTPAEVEEIKSMIKKKEPYINIVNKYGISKTFISDINNGKYFYNEKETYPLCPYRIDDDTYSLLIEDLEKPVLTYKELAKKYDLAESTVKKFNYGTLRPGYYQGEYPIRKITPSDYKADIAIDYLINSDLSKKEICEQAQISEETLRKINLGIRHKKDYLTYPLR